MPSKQDKHGTIQRYENGCNAWLNCQREAYSRNLKTIPKPKSPKKKSEAD